MLYYLNGKKEVNILRIISILVNTIEFLYLIIWGIWKYPILIAWNISCFSNTISIEKYLYIKMKLIKFRIIGN